MADHHGSPLGPGVVAEEESPSAPEAHKQFHYGIFRARAGRSVTPVEILDAAPLPITHLKTRDHRAEAGIGHRDASEGQILSGVGSRFSKLVRVVQLFGIRTFR